MLKQINYIYLYLSLYKTFVTAHSTSILVAKKYPGCVKTCDLKHDKYCLNLKAFEDIQMYMAKVNHKTPY